MFKLVHRQIARSATAEIDKVGFATTDERFGGVNREFLEGRLDVTANSRGIFICVNLEITKVAALSAERDMHVDAQRHPRSRWTLERGIQFLHLILFPKGERGIVGNEIIPDRGLFLQGRGQWAFRVNGGATHMLKSFAAFASECINVAIVTSDDHFASGNRRRTVDGLPNLVGP